MTVKQAIEQLQQLPADAQVGSYNPVFAETIYLNNFVQDTDKFIQVEFTEWTCKEWPECDCPECDDHREANRMARE